jgi:ubiquinol-cytochrome c reductase cytochrome b/c1 subunit
MMATAFMGYVLPWGQMSFWGAKVITNLFSAIPFVGESITTWLWGGYSVDNPTLNRFFSLHYLLPFVLAAVVGLHIWALHVPGNANPTGVEVKSGQDTLPFHPYYTMKDAFAIVVFLLFFAAWTSTARTISAMPSTTSRACQPAGDAGAHRAGMVLPAVLRDPARHPDKLGGVIAMFGSILILFVLPWLDTSRVRSGSYRPVFKGFFWIFAIVCVALGYLGSKPPEAPMCLGAHPDRLLLRALHHHPAAAGTSGKPEAAAGIDFR